MTLRLSRPSTFSHALICSGCLRGHLRLTAATALLKLAILAENEKEISNSAFETVAYVVQVSNDSPFIRSTRTEIPTLNRISTFKFAKHS